MKYQSLREIIQDYASYLIQRYEKKSKQNILNEISFKEAKESVYWLRVLKELYEDDQYKNEFDIYLKESNELKIIFLSIKKSSSENK